MNWPKLLGFVGIFLAGAVIGWLLHAPGVPKIEIKERVKYDTVYQTQNITFTKTRIDTVLKITDSKFAYTDSIMGDTNKVKYKIQHSISNDKKLVTSWKVDLVPKLQFITRIVTRDSIQTKIEKEFYAQPWFIDSWFYMTIVTIGLLIISLIF